MGLFERNIAASEGIAHREVVVGGKIFELLSPQEVQMKGLSIPDRLTFMEGVLADEDSRLTAEEKIAFEQNYKTLFDYAEQATAPERTEQRKAA